MGQVDEIKVDEIFTLNEEPEIIVITSDNGEPIQSFAGVGLKPIYNAKVLDYSLVEEKVCTYTELPAEPGAESYMIPYARGMRLEYRPVLPGYDTGVSSYVFGVFILIALNLRNYSTLLKGFTRDLFSVKSCDNVFSDNKVTEINVVLSLIMFMCVSAGIILNTVVKIPYFESFPKVVPMVVFAFGMLALYFWQLAVYNVLGYVFARRDMKRVWLRGFNASQVLLGLILWVPALMTLFDPTKSKFILILSTFIYVVVRLIFIVKGFRIFYTNLYSLVYFILYLCSLEIIPIILVYNIISYLTLS